jgi:eukaryotic-like serine/threonine-protein kinase
MLWMNGSAPLHYARFLDYAVERILLGKVGGGYIFIHRMVLEYFASLATGPNQIKP